MEYHTVGFLKRNVVSGNLTCAKCTGCIHVRIFISHDLRYTPSHFWGSDQVEIWTTARFHFLQCLFWLSETERNLFSEPINNSPLQTAFPSFAKSCASSDSGITRQDWCVPFHKDRTPPCCIFPLRTKVSFLQSWRHLSQRLYYFVTVTIIKDKRILKSGGVRSPVRCEG